MLSDVTIVQYLAVPFELIWENKLNFAFEDIGFGYIEGHGKSKDHTRRYTSGVQYFGTNILLSVKNYLKHENVSSVHFFMRLCII